VKQYPFIISIQHRHYLVKRHVTENITLPLLGSSNICIYFSFGFILYGGYYRNDREFKVLGSHSGVTDDSRF
jgi:hypothetical protein